MCIEKNYKLYLKKEKKLSGRETSFFSVVFFVHFQQNHNNNNNNVKSALKFVIDYRAKTITTKNYLSELEKCKYLTVLNVCELFFKSMVLTFLKQINEEKLLFV